jgi:transcription elongation GreA/GreB family factor
VAVTTADSTGRSGLDPQARGRLEEELARLRERRRSLGADFDDRDPVGDRADDAESLELADDVAWLDDRIDELVGLLTGADGSDEPSATDRLPDGTVVTLRFADGTVQTLRVVAITEEIPEGREDTTLTTHSPLSRALAGHRQGDTVTYPTPDGPARAEVIDLRPPNGG